MDLKKFQEVDKNSEYAVFGYIRNIQKYFPQNTSYYIIPEDIIQICTIFYFVDYDEWSAKYKSDLFVINKNIIEKYERSQSNSAFLTNIVYGGKHHWKFKVLSCSSYLRFGIWKNSVPIYTHHLNSFIGNNPDTAYVFYATYACLYLHKYGNSYTDNDTYGIRCKSDNMDIDMFIDFNKFELSFSINGKHYGKAFKIDDDKYRAAISMDSKGAKIELVSYRHYN